MKMKLLFIPTMTVVMSALLGPSKETRVKEAVWPTKAAWTTTTVHPGLNLNGKMFTLSLSRGGQISFYPPSASSSGFKPFPTRPYRTTRYRTTTRPYPAPHVWPYHHPSLRPTTRPYRTTRYPTTTRYPRYPTTTRPYRTTHKTTPHPYYSTVSPTRGVTVCLRYIIDNLQSPSLFTLSPSRSPLTVSVNSASSYWVNFNSYGSMYLRPSIRMWSNVGLNIWTSVCLTVDTMKNVAQVFSDSNMSIRKLLPYQYVWSGEPVITFAGFDGQFTDVQVWDYPLCYKEVFYYMTRGFYRSYRGSVLTWSDISYSVRGGTLLEDSYELQQKQSVGRGGRGGREGKGYRLKAEKMPRKFFSVVGNKEIMI